MRELLRAIVLAARRRHRVHAFPIGHRAGVRILGEQAVDEGGSRSHPADEKDRRRDLGVQNLWHVAKRLFDSQVLACHAQAVHLRRNPAGEAERRIFLHGAKERVERGHRLGPRVPDSGVLSLSFREPGLGRGLAEARQDASDAVHRTIPERLRSTRRGELLRAEGFFAACSHAREI